MLDPVKTIVGRTGYSVPRPRHDEELLRLDGNEGLRPDAALFGVLRDAELIRRYPDAVSLTQRIAQRHGLDASRILVTAGADEGLDRVCRAWLDDSRALLLPSPGFEMLTRYAELARARVLEYEWLEREFPLGPVLDQLESADVLAVVTPNNPTGLAIDRESFVELCRRTRGKLLLVDLAYVEFAAFDPTEIAIEHEHVVVVRSLSKGWGIAGLRIGYVCAAPRAIGALRAAGGPYSVAAPSLALAHAWLERGETIRRSFAIDVATRRQRLYDLFSARGIEYWPSEANFVMFRVEDAAGMHEAVARHGVAIRAFPGHPTIGNCLRATCGGDEDEQARLEHALIRAWEETMAGEAEERR